MSRKMFCPHCNEYIEEPSVHSWGPEWVRFHTGRCPKCETQLREQQPATVPSTPVVESPQNNPAPAQNTSNLSLLLQSYELFFKRFAAEQRRQWFDSSAASDARRASGVEQIQCTREELNNFSRAIKNYSGTHGFFYTGIFIEPLIDYLDDVTLTLDKFGRKIGYLGKGLIRGTLNIQGNAGDFLGEAMTGGRIVVTGNAGHGVGELMRGGEIFVGGEAESVGPNITGGKIFIGRSVKFYPKNQISDYDIKHSEIYVKNKLILSR